MAHGPCCAGEEPRAERRHDRHLQMPQRHAAALCALGADARARAAARCACSRAAASSSRSISRWSPTCAGAASRSRPWTGAARAARSGCSATRARATCARSPTTTRTSPHFMKEIVLPDCQPPYVALAHSMGGHILLRNASLSGSWFSRMVLSRAHDRHRPRASSAPRTPSARLCARRLARIGLRLAVCARAAATAARVRALRGQPAHLRPRALPAQPADPGGGARRSASARRPSAGCARRCARSPG